MVSIISFGGVGGCELGRVCRFFDGYAHPFDWNVVRHDFVQDVLQSHGQIFFSFTENQVSGTMITSYDKRYILLHDKVTDLAGVKEKYYRRLQRMFDTLYTIHANDIILCLRIMCCIDEPMELMYKKVYDPLPETPEDWRETMKRLRSINPNIYLILFEKDKSDSVSSIDDGIFVARTPDYKNPKHLRGLVKEFLDSFLSVSSQRCGTQPRVDEENETDHQDIIHNRS